MKNLFKLPLIVMLLLSAACSKKDDTTPNENNNNNNQQQKATLAVVVSEEARNPDGTMYTKISSGAKVQLYPTLQDRKDKTNPLSDLIQSGSDGKVTFEGLEAKVYYFNAYNSDMTKSNMNSGGTTNALVLGETTTTSTMVK